jgi:hypothetical protein
MTDSAVARKLDLGQVIRLTFSAIGGNFLDFTILVLVFAVLPIVVIEYVFMQYLPGSAEFGPSYLLLTVAEAIPVAIATGAITQGAILHFDGQKAALGDCLTVGIRLLPQLLVVSILCTIAIMLGLLVLVIPGILVSITLAVATPALVVEKPGIFGSLTRSSNLTKGSRWGVFWLGAAFGVAYALISFGVGYLMGAVAQLSAEESLLDPPVWLNLLIIGVATTLSTLIASAGAAALYYELRTMKEGATSGELAEVFV